MAGLVLGAAILAVVVLALLLATRAGGGTERIVRCGAGHLFTSTVIPGASLKAVRLGSVRFQRCPVGRHWAFVRRVDPASLTPDELASARSIRDVRLP